MFKAYKNFDVDVFGASHAEEIGVIIDGFPVGSVVDAAALQAFLDRRKSGNNPWSTPRKEDDKIEFESGIDNGVITGTVKAVIKNRNARSSDYSAFSDTPRPSHADYAAEVKYGGKADMRGGGRYSGRMTAALCIAGGIALQLLEKEGVKIAAYVSRVGSTECRSYLDGATESEAEEKRKQGLFTLSVKTDKAATDEIMAAREIGDSVGGDVECIAVGLPVGLGDALYDGLEGRISLSVFSIPAVKAVEFGAGCEFGKMHGSAANDCLTVQNGTITTVTNNCGGITGGISNGMPITLRATFKPTPSIALPQQTVSLNRLENTTLSIGGRHDACIVVRAVPVVEAAVALAVYDCLTEEQQRKAAARPQKTKKDEVSYEH